MGRGRLTNLCKQLLIANMIFWLWLAAYSVWRTDHNSHWLMKSLLVGESISYFIGYLSVVNKNRVGYFFAVSLALGNVVLSLTDQVGLVDVLSLGLSGLAFFSLVLAKIEVFG